MTRSKYNPRSRKKKDKDSTPGELGPARIAWTIIDEECPEFFHGPYDTEEWAKRAAMKMYMKRPRSMRVVRLKLEEQLSYRFSLPENFDFEYTYSFSDPHGNEFFVGTVEMVRKQYPTGTVQGEEFWEDVYLLEECTATPKNHQGDAITVQELFAAVES